MPLLRINRHPSRAQLYVFAAAWCIVIGALGIGLRVRGLDWTSEAFTFAAVVMPLLAWRAPAVVRGVYLALTYATYPFGFVLSYVVLAVLYFAVFTPIGLIMRALGRDPLSRRVDRTAPSYWEKRPPTPHAESYLRQR